MGTIFAYLGVFMKKESIYKIVKYITAFFSVVMIICLIVQLARIYFGDLTPKYSRSLVTKYLAQILPVIIIWVIAVIVGIVFAYLVSEKKHLYVKTTNEAKLKLYEAKLPANIEENENYTSLKLCHKKMKIALIISLVIYAVCLVMISLYLFNPSHFIYNGEINRQVIELLIHASPWLAISLVTIIAYTLYINHVSKKGITYALAIIKSAGMSKEIKYKKHKYGQLIINISRLAIILVAIVLISVGVAAGEHLRVLQKAINICTECIGLG